MIPVVLKAMLGDKEVGVEVWDLSGLINAEPTAPICYFFETRDGLEVSATAPKKSFRAWRLNSREGLSYKDGVGGAATQR